MFTFSNRNQQNLNSKELPADSSVASSSEISDQGVAQGVAQGATGEIITLRTLAREATAKPQTAKGGSKDPKFTPEKRGENEKIWTHFLVEQDLQGLSQEQLRQILFCLSIGRYSPDVLEMMTHFGLPLPERGSLSLEYFQTLHSTAKRLFLERVEGLSLEEIQCFLKQLTSESTLGDEGQVSGDFPNQVGLKAKFHTLHFQDAKDILFALLEQAKCFGATITEIMTLKLDGSCVVLRGGKLVFPGSGLEIKPDIEKRVSALEKSIQKVSKSITDRMPAEKKMEKQKELEQMNIQLAFFQKMLLDIAEIESTGVEGSTYEIFFLGNEMNDLTSAMYLILSGKTIIIHSDLAIPEMVLPPQDPDSTQPASQFLQIDKAEILQRLNELCKARCEAIINAGRDSAERQPFVFQSVPILKETAMSSVCEGGVLHIRVSFRDETVFRICLKVKNPEMNQERRNHCIYSETFTEADNYALLKEWLIPAEVPAVEAVFPSAGGGQAGEP
jgi:hypothetical protein